MRRLRMTLGLAVAVCASATFAAPALAHREKPRATLGKFLASRSDGVPITPSDPAIARTKEGSVTFISLADETLNIEEGECGKIRSTGEVTSERSEEFFQEITFSKCKATFHSKNGKERAEIPKFKLAFVFHSNEAGRVGSGESEVDLGRSAIFIKTRKRPEGCTVEVPQQSLPVKAERKPEEEFESTEYSTEREPAKLKKFPKGFRERLEVAVELKKIISYEVPDPPYCEPEGGFKADKGIVEFELEEIGIKKGNLGFETKQEVEAEG